MTQAAPTVRGHTFRGQYQEFIARLRAAGLVLGPGEAALGLQALDALPLLDLQAARDGLRMVLTARPEEAEVFDALFTRTFLERAERQPAPPEAGRKPAPPGGSPEPPTQEQRAGPQMQGEGEGASGQGTPTQVRRQGEDEDGAEEGGQALRSVQSEHAGEGSPPGGHAGELRPLLVVADALLRALRLGRSRRWRPLASGRRFHFRGTLRAALATGGEPLRPRWLGRPRRDPRFLIILDGSRSMAAHAELLLSFAHALSLRSRRVEVYAFSTTLERLTPHLDRAPLHAPLTLPDLGEAWGGGTRIGEALWSLLRSETARLNAQTVTVVLSDGLDTGEPEVLATAVRELARRSGLLVWLNPLAGLPGYLPLARGMAASLPHLDLFLAAGGLDELRALPGRVRRGG